MEAILEHLRTNFFPLLKNLSLITSVFQIYGSSGKSVIYNDEFLKKKEKWKNSQIEVFLVMFEL